MQQIHKFEHIHACKCERVAIFQVYLEKTKEMICPECYLELLRKDLIKEHHDHDIAL